MSRMVWAPWRSLLLALALTGVGSFSALAEDNAAAEEPADASSKASAEAEVFVSRLEQGLPLLRDGQPQRAIEEVFQPVIDHFENAYKNRRGRVYSARHIGQAVMYAALPKEEGEEAVVLDSTWADAYWLKAYAHIELGQFEQAKTALEAALELSPMCAEYWSELGFVFQRLADCDRSIEVYARAESMAELASEEEHRSHDIARAIRGQGCRLIEQRKWDEAEAMYKRALELDPQDRLAMSQLEYIRATRPKDRRDE